MARLVIAKPGPLAPQAAGLADGDLVYASGVPLAVYVCVGGRLVLISCAEGFLFPSQLPALGPLGALHWRGQLLDGRAVVFERLGSEWGLDVATRLEVYGPLTRVRDPPLCAQQAFCAKLAHRGVSYILVYETDVYDLEPNSLAAAHARLCRHLKDDDLEYTLRSAPLEGRVALYSRFWCFSSALYGEGISRWLPAASRLN